MAAGEKAKEILCAGIKSLGTTNAVPLQMVYTCVFKTGEALINKLTTLID